MIATKETVLARGAKLARCSRQRVVRTDAPLLAVASLRDRNGGER
jgi:hypothetical protein